MDYEKKDFRKLYEDLVKSDWFKRAYHNKSLGEYPFDIPELAESEDERTRKHLIKVVELYWGTTNEPGKAEDLAWLEKRKENTWSEEDDAKVGAMCKEGNLKPSERAWLKNLRNRVWKDPQHAIRVTKGFGDPDGPQFELVDLPEEQKPIPANSVGLKEQKPVELDEYTKTNLDRALQIIKKAKGTLQGYQSDDGIYECDKAIECLEHFLYRGLEIERTMEWNEDYREEDIQTRFAFYTYKDDPSVIYLSNVFVEEASRNHGFGSRILKAAEKVAETIGATTISLKVKQDSPANAWYRKNGYGYVAFEDEYDWLEKNLEYMKPNKQEWSEEDEKNLKSVVSTLWFALNTPHFPLNYERIIELEGWLKSLRPPFKDKEMKLKILKYLSTRCSSLEFEEVEDYLNNLRPSWKPGEEQMDALHYVKQFDYGGHKAALESLYEQLKKL